MMKMPTIALLSAFALAASASAQAAPAPTTQPQGDDIYYSGPLNADISEAYVNWQTGEICEAIDNCDIFAYQMGVQPWTFWDGEDFVTHPVFVFILPDQGGVFFDPYLGVLNHGDAVHSGQRFDDGLGNVGGGVWDGTPSTPWWSGRDAYLGFSLRNRDTHQINFGYAHIVTTGPTGYPVILADYAYDRTGAGIAIPTDPLAPSVRLGFEPSLVVTGDTTTLTITLRNGNGVDALLLDDFIDTMPEGFIASNATSTCGSVSLGEGGGSVILSMQDARIPATGECTIIATVQPNVAGAHTHRVPAATLLTDQGPDLADATAVLYVYDDNGPFPPAENFDTTAAPALPPTGWFSIDWLGNFTLAPGLPPSAWVSTDQKADSGTQSLYVTDATELGGGGYSTDISLLSPVFVPGRNASVSFRQNYTFFETVSMHFDDGGVLEISIDGGPFVDILQAGGYFGAGGYTDSIGDAPDNALHGRLAWGSFTDDVWYTTTAGLPPQAEGRPVQLRWRFGTDHVNKSEWWIDTVQADLGSTASTHPPRLAAAFEPPAVSAGGTSRLVLTLSNDQDLPAVLTQDFVDVLPQGLVASDPATDCTCATSACEISVGNGGELRLPLNDQTGYLIPAGASCVVTANITASQAGSYINTLAPDALTINWKYGNRHPATARLVAMPLADCMFADGFDGGTGCDAASGTFTDIASFVGVLAPGYYEEFFDTIDAGQMTSWIAPGANGYGFILDSAGYRDVGLYTWPNIVSTDRSLSIINVTFAGSAITAIGGNFWATDVEGEPSGTDIVIHLGDGSSYSFTSSGPDDFRGFVFDAPISGISIDAPPTGTDGDLLFARMSNLIVGARK